MKKSSRIYEEFLVFKHFIEIKKKFFTNRKLISVKSYNTFSKFCRLHTKILKKFWKILKKFFFYFVESLRK